MLSATGAISAAFSRTLGEVGKSSFLSDGSNEAPNIDNEVVVNERFRGEIKTGVSVSNKKYTIDINLTADTDFSNLEDAALAAISIEKQLRLRGKKLSNGYTLDVEVSISLVDSGGDISINNCPGACINPYSIQPSGGYARLSGRTMYLKDISWSAGHEMGHILGLQHQGGGTGSLMSYDENRSFFNGTDAERLFKAYRKNGY
ncbi:hypothetical protein [Shewanella colwelliana]|uniref:hypothetical protein n=1 Tax=Shewanella colwelliana TaxID=23 RepID=UPI00048CC8BB|nr:hypothetical protein [Shewanella colwelliana]